MTSDKARTPRLGLSLPTPETPPPPPPPLPAPVPRLRPPPPPLRSDIVAVPVTVPLRRLLTKQNHASAPARAHPTTATPTPIPDLAPVDNPPPPPVPPSGTVVYPTSPVAVGFPAAHPAVPLTTVQCMRLSQHPAAVSSHACCVVAVHCGSAGFSPPVAEEDVDAETVLRQRPPETHVWP